MTFPRDTSVRAWALNSLATLSDAALARSSSVISSNWRHPQVRRYVPAPAISRAHELRALPGSREQDIITAQLNLGFSPCGDFNILFATLVVACTHSVPTTGPLPAAGPFENIITNGRIVDGTGDAWFYGRRKTIQGQKTPASRRAGLWTMRRRSDA